MADNRDSLQPAAIFPLPGGNHAVSDLDVQDSGAPHHTTVITRFRAGQAAPGPGQPPGGVREAEYAQAFQTAAASLRPTAWDCSTEARM